MFIASTFAALLLVCSYRISHFDAQSTDVDDRVEVLESGQFKGNWSQGALRDNAAEGCPHQYHQWTTGPDGRQWLTGCWGVKDSEHVER